MFGGKVIKKIVSRADAKKTEARRVRAILKQSVLNAKTSPTLSKTPAKLLNSNVVNQPLIVRCHLPEKQISTFINHLRQELQTSPDLALNETSMELIEEEIDVVEHIKQETDVNPNQILSNVSTNLLKEDSNVAIPDAKLSNPYNLPGAQLNSPPSVDIIDIITLDDLDANVTSTSGS